MKKDRKLQDRFRRAREELGLSRAQLAEKMNVDVTSIGFWETGRRAPTLEKLLRMVHITGFTAQYLLGYDDIQTNWTKPLSRETLAAMHRAPVWMASRGWALVNAATRSFVFADQTAVEMEAVQEPVYGFPPILAYSLYGAGEPLRLYEVEQKSRVWVEPITKDLDLGLELRGWYHPHKNRLVQNEFGNRFYLDTYGVKWLAFHDCFDGTDEDDLDE